VTVVMALFKGVEGLDQALGDVNHLPHSHTQLPPNADIHKRLGLQYSLTCVMMKAFGGG
jgi:hypothetical protein